MKKILTLAAMMLLTVMGLSACTAKTNKAKKVTSTKKALLSKCFFHGGELGI